MPQARLRLTLPEDLWIGQVSRAYPDMRIRVLTAFADDESGVALLEVETGDPAALIADLTGYEAVTDIDLLARLDEQVVIQIETDDPMLLYPVRQSGVPLEFPFTLQDGEAVWDLTAPRDRLSTLGEQLREFGIEFEVDYVRRLAEGERLLADRQQELLEAAVERGYYDTPRECTLTELADHLGMAKSTVSETLHRAEEQVIKEYIGESEGTADRREVGTA